MILVSSIIGYIIEEKSLLNRYQWELSKLKYAVIELQTIPESKSNDYRFCFQKIVYLRKSIFGN